MTQPVTFDEYWPQWPAETTGQLLIEEYFQTTVAELMQLLWSPESAFLAEANSERNYSEYHSTDWVVSEEELPDLPGGFNWTYERSVPRQCIADMRGRLRKVRFETKGGNFLTAQGFKTEEVQRCLSYDEERGAVVDACVNSTAPFCENIRVTCRYLIEAMGDGRCRLSVSYQLVFIKSVNGILRTVLQRGAKEGLVANYKTFKQVLLSHVQLAAKEGLLPAVPTAEQGSEMTSVPVRARTPYRSVVNWAALPASTWLRDLSAVYVSNSRASLSIEIFRAVSTFVIISVSCALLGAVMCLWLSAFEMWISRTTSLPWKPELTSQQFLVVGLVFLIFLEITKFSMYCIREIFVRLWIWFVDLCGCIKPLTWSRAHTIKRHSSHLVSQESLGSSVGRLEKEASFAISAEGLEDDSTSLYQKFINGFWTLLSYNSPDFPKFDHTIPIEGRTNPDGSVVEEMFENERLQPFRGWGHTWPGHFLPTDRFNQWSSFNRNGDIVTSYSFSLVEPSLPEGWEWKEDEWEIDKSRLATNAVDADGWYYSLDFPWIKFIPERNSGIKRLHDFVRRRRWTRTRVKRDACELSTALSGTAPEKPTDQISYFSFTSFL